MWMKPRVWARFCAILFFTPKSALHHSEQAARLQSGSMQRVGVFVEQNAGEIARIMREARLDLAQLHGGQSVACARDVGAERVIRVLWPDRYMHRALLHNELQKYARKHGVATAAAAARLGMDCVIYMGGEDVERQSANVRRMKLLGAEVHAVQSGTRTLKDAINEALRAWIASQQTTHYCFGTAAGPHPFPTLVRRLQSVIGRETRAQMLEKTGRLPDAVVACVGGGSNAIGMFHPFLEDADVRLVGVEAAGTGETGCFNSAPLNLGTPGVLHGNYSMLLQNNDGQIEPSHSISAGLDYPGVGPEHAFLHKSGRVHYGMVKDANALAAFLRLCRSEGILPALESSHALAWVLDHPQEFTPGSHVVVNLSGRGDKDMDIIRAALAEKEV